MPNLTITFTKKGGEEIKVEVILERVEMLRAGGRFYKDCVGEE